MLRLSLLLLLLAFGPKLFGQSDLTLYNMPASPQRLYQNPAFYVPVKWTVGLPFLPGVGAHFYNSGFRWSNLVTKVEGEPMRLEPENVLDKLKKRNILVAKANYDLFSVGFKTSEQSFLSVDVRSKADFRFAYPGDLMKLAWRGNAPYVGQELDFSYFGPSLTTYTEYGVGYNFEVMNKWRFGARVKMLSGTFNINPEATLKLLTEPETYNIKASTSYRIQTSGFYNLDGEDIRPGAFVFGKNIGAGIDIGAVYKYSDKIEISASIMDLGFIRWKNDPFTLSSKEAQFYFNGVDVSNYIKDNQIKTDSSFEAFFDSVANVLSPDTSFSPYTTPTTARFNLGGHYISNAKWTAGLLISTEVFRGRLYPSATASISTRFGRILSGSLSYTAMKRSISNLGLGLSLNLGPVQIFAISDNVAGFFVPQHVKLFHAYGGIRLTWLEKVEKKEK